MQETVNERFIEMSLPAERDMMIVVRLTASGVLARSGLSLDALGDLKMAVEEACTCLISQISGCGRLDLRFELGENATRINCRCADCCTMGEAVNPAEIEVVQCILESMVDSAEIITNDGYISNICLTTAKKC